MKRRRMGVMIDLDLYMELKALAVRKRLTTYEAIEEAMALWVAQEAKRREDRQQSYGEAMRQKLGWSADSH